MSRLPLCVSLLLLGLVASVTVGGGDTCFKDSLDIAFFNVIDCGGGFGRKREINYYADGVLSGIEQPIDSFNDIGCFGFDHIDELIPVNRDYNVLIIRADNNIFLEDALQTDVFTIAASFQSFVDDGNMIIFLGSGRDDVVQLLMGEAYEGECLFGYPEDFYDFPSEPLCEPMLIGPYGDLVGLDADDYPDGPAGAFSSASCLRPTTGTTVICLSTIGGDALGLPLYTINMGANDGLFAYLGSAPTGPEFFTGYDYNNELTYGFSNIAYNNLLHSARNRTVECCDETLVSSLRIGFFNSLGCFGEVSKRSALFNPDGVLAGIDPLLPFEFLEDLACFEVQSQFLPRVSYDYNVLIIRTGEDTIYDAFFGYDTLEEIIASFQEFVDRGNVIIFLGDQAGRDPIVTELMGNATESTCLYDTADEFYDFPAVEVLCDPMLNGPFGDLRGVDPDVTYSDDIDGAGFYMANCLSPTTGVSAQCLATTYDGDALYSINWGQNNGFFAFLGAGATQDDLYTGFEYNYELTYGFSNIVYNNILDFAANNTAESSCTPTPIPTPNGCSVKELNVGFFTTNNCGIYIEKRDIRENADGVEDGIQVELDSFNDIDCLDGPAELLPSVNTDYNVLIIRTDGNDLDNALLAPSFDIIQSFQEFVDNGNMIIFLGATSPEDTVVNTLMGEGDDYQCLYYGYGEYPSFNDFPDEDLCAPLLNGPYGDLTGTNPTDDYGVDYSSPSFYGAYCLNPNLETSAFCLTTTIYSFTDALYSIHWGENHGLFTHLGSGNSEFYYEYNAELTYGFSQIAYNNLLSYAREFLGEAFSCSPSVTISPSASSSPSVSGFTSSISTSTTPSISISPNPSPSITPSASISPSAETSFTPLPTPDGCTVKELNVGFFTTNCGDPIIYDRKRDIRADADGVIEGIEVELDSFTDIECEDGRSQLLPSVNTDYNVLVIRTDMVMTLENALLEPDSSAIIQSLQEFVDNGNMIIFLGATSPGDVAVSTLMGEGTEDGSCVYYFGEGYYSYFEEFPYEELCAPLLNGPYGDLMGMNPYYDFYQFAYSLEFYGAYCLNPTLGTSAQCLLVTKLNGNTESLYSIHWGENHGLFTHLGSGNTQDYAIFDFNNEYNYELKKEGFPNIAYNNLLYYAREFLGEVTSCSPTFTISPSVISTTTSSISISPSPSPSLALSATVTTSISVTPTTSVSVSITPTESLTPSPSATITTSISVTPTTSVSVSITPTISITPTETPSPTASISITATISISASRSGTGSSTISTTPSVSLSGSDSGTGTSSITTTPTVSVTSTGSDTASSTSSSSLSSSETPIVSPTSTVSMTNTPVPSNTPTPSGSITRSRTPAGTLSTTPSGEPVLVIIPPIVATPSVRRSNNVPFIVTINCVGDRLEDGSCAPVGSNTIIVPLSSDDADEILIYHDGELIGIVSVPLEVREDMPDGTEIHIETILNNELSDDPSINSPIINVDMFLGGLVIPLSGGSVEICLKHYNGEGDDDEDHCLGYEDGHEKWRCEDRCTKGRDDDDFDFLVCGDTDHFTNFALLLQGGDYQSADDDPCESPEYDPLWWWLSLVAVGIAICFTCFGIVAVELRFRYKHHVNQRRMNQHSQNMSQVMGSQGA